MPHIPYSILIYSESAGRRFQQEKVLVGASPVTVKLSEGSLTALKAEEHFVVVGAGVAGLTSAYILLQLGHKV